MNTVLPPPPPPRSDNSWVKWGVITCCAGCLGIIGLLVVAGFWVGPKLMPMLQGPVRAAQQVQVCGPEMQRVWRAVEKYHADKGAYPDSLHQLVPTYIRDPSQLKFSGIPQGPEFTYHKPGPSAASTDAVLEYSIPVPMPASVPQKMSYELSVAKDGSFKFQQSQTFPGGSRRRRGSPAPTGGGSTSDED